MYLPPLDTEGYQVVCIKYSFISNLSIQLNSVRVRFVTDKYIYILAFETLYPES